LRDHIIICGWNRSGKNMLAELAKSPELFENGLVMVAEFDEEPDLSEYAIDPDKIFIVHDDYTQLSVLKQCGGEHADIALLLADRTKERGSQDTDARTVLAAIAIERMNPNIFSSVELLNRENGAHLKVMGVEEIVVGDEYAGTLIAMGLRNRGISVLIDELMSIEGNGFFKAPIPQSLVGATIIDVSTRLRDDHNAILVAVETRDGQARQVVVNPDSELKLKTGDLIFVISEHSPRLA